MRFFPPRTGKNGNKKGPRRCAQALDVLQSLPRKAVPMDSFHGPAECLVLLTPRIPKALGALTLGLSHCWGHSTAFSDYPSPDFPRKSKSAPLTAWTDEGRTDGRRAVWWGVAEAGAPPRGTATDRAGHALPGSRANRFCPVQGHGCFLDRKSPYCIPQCQKTARSAPGPLAALY